MRARSRCFNSLAKYRRPIASQSEILEPVLAPWLRDRDTLYKSLTTKELIRAAAVFGLCSVEPLVSNASRLLSISNAVIGKSATAITLQATFYGQFCGGEESDDLQGKIAALGRAGVMSILDYAAEAEVDSGDPSASVALTSSEASLNAHTKNFLRSIEEAALSPRGSIALKLTALFDPVLLQQINQYAPKSTRGFSDLDGLEQAVLNSAKGDDARLKLKAGIERLLLLGEAARKAGVRILVDAEQSYFQDIIRMISLVVMAKVNREYPAVYTTYQGYLKKSLEVMTEDRDFMKQLGAPFGCKVVRGAYMALERTRAAEFGHASPVFDSKEETDRNYDTLCEDLMRRPDGVEVLMATHNEDSVLTGLRNMGRFNIPKKGPVAFAQLLGMRDNISLALGRDGYLVYKYIPYGPVDLVVPYLIRRMEENSSSSSMLTGLSRERAEINQEIFRRLGIRK